MVRKGEIFVHYSVLKHSFDIWHKEISAEACGHSCLGKEDNVWTSLNAKLPTENINYQQ